MRFTELKGGADDQQGSISLAVQLHLRVSHHIHREVSCRKQQLNVFSLEHFLPAVVNDFDLQTSFIMAEQKLHVIIVGAGMNTAPMFGSKC